MDIGQRFARNLKKIRRLRQLSQERLAHQAGLDRSYISSLERLKYSPTLETITLLSRALDIDDLDLLKPESELILPPLT